MSRQSAKTPRNPGPGWGYQFLRLADLALPEFVFRPLRAAGTWVAVACMPRQRCASRQFLSGVFGRRASLREVFGHFFAFEECLMLKLRLANGLDFPCRYAPGSDAFRKWMEEGGRMLFGTMHVGVSDLLGFQLSPHTAREIAMVRMRVGNSHDTEALVSALGGRLRFVWVNHPDEVIFAVKEAAETSDAIVMQCDRVGTSSRVERFCFLGRERTFPLSIYHLARLFDRPVILVFGLPDAGRGSVLHCSPRFDLVDGETRDAMLARAHGHFAAFLAQAEEVLRARPEFWFNFEDVS